MSVCTDESLTGRPKGAAAALASMEDDLCRLVLAVRTAMAVVATVGLSLAARPGPAAIGAAFVMLATSYLPYHFWVHIGGWLRTHPYVILADAVATAWLLASFGPDSPCLLVSVAAVPLAGLLGGIRLALPFAVAQLGAYAWAMTQPPAQRLRWADDTTIAAVGLYLVAAAMGVALRRWLTRRAVAERVAREVCERTAAAEERARLARDLHDSFGKTLHGIGLAAQALTLWIARDGAAAAQRATALALSSDAAVSQLRQVIAGLRDRVLPAELPDAVRSVVDRWSAGSGIEVVTRIDDEGATRLDAFACAQTLAVLDEALVNVERHANARRVNVTMRRQRGTVELRVRDDGRGFDRCDLRDHRRASFGLIGMAERAHCAGGDLTVWSYEGGGVEVRLRFPINVVNTVDNGGSLTQLRRRWR